ncbi:hypothetical protein [Dyella caseinilytica]|uniref:Uncharacterized protein n=1 Tax=Dyella caseinilytica TaxID=1849581 RepID=A0ABX7GY77_9GAMM|nr:hypothetical protein [Dyella caseinilytica]QRN54903.1 hypothetical protein ISN74_06005 [Dyella caseinilytica]GFZ97792.1 hypothetical protein GCM10011408_17870 [Dyella caseinilytica]
MVFKQLTLEGIDMKNDVIVVYSNNDDVMTRAFDEMRDDRRGCNLTFIHIDELADCIKLSPWPKVLEAQWGDLPDLFNGAFVFNRVFSLDGTEIRHTLNDWRCDERWFHVRLNQLLAKAGTLAHDTGVQGASRTLLPLNTQWFYVGNAQSTFKVPDFSYGFAREQPDLSRLTSPFQKSIWSISDWKVERNLSPAEENWHRFYVERPRGTPVVGYYLEDEVNIIFPSKEIHVDIASLKLLTQTVRDKFHSLLGEILFYVEDDGSYRYYAFSPFLASAANDPLFAKKFCSWIQKRFEANG